MWCCEIWTFSIDITTDYILYFNPIQFSRYFSLPKMKCTDMCRGILTKRLFISPLNFLLWLCRSWKKLSLKHFSVYQSNISMHWLWTRITVGMPTDNSDICGYTIFNEDESMLQNCQKRFWYSFLLKHFRDNFAR